MTCFSDQAADFNIYSLNNFKNFCVKKFFKIIQNGGAHGGSNSLMNGLLPPWAPPFCNIFKNFFNKKFLDLSLEITLNSAGHSENLDFFHPCLLKMPRISELFYSHLPSISIAPPLLYINGRAYRRNTDVSISQS